MFLTYQVNEDTRDYFQNEEVLVLGEDEKDVISYSRSTTHNLYSYTEKKYSNLIVPYTTIKHSKNARQYGIREAVYEVFHRPDKSPILRSMLDLWGFDNYHNYLYTVCELGFLEGLIPVIDFGFLTPDEIADLMEVVAVIRTLVYTDYDCLMDQDDIRTLKRSFEIRSKVLSWASKLQLPISTGIFVHSDLDKGRIKEFADLIGDMAQSSHCFHDVMIQTRSRTPDISCGKLTDKQLITIYELLRNKVPEHIPVVIQDPSIPMADMMISNGEKDLGSLSDDLFSLESAQQYWDDLQALLKKKRLRLQLRFPLRKSFIKQQQYSKKLGQLFDAFKYKIKKDLLEKQKYATM
tara:strand:+ start:129 stop:1178 length:1050 start_codon:yes stop_codon:yes gene_type:complete